MKRKIVLSIFLMLTATFALKSQNSHNMFTSSAGDIISSVTVSNMNSFQNYMVGTDEFVSLFITEFDNTSPYPQPINTNSRSFALPTTYGKIYLTGGFFDLDDNIVVYGYTETDNRGVVVKINMVSGEAVSIIRLIGNANTIITDGCWSRRFMGGTTYNPTYTFVSNNSLVRTSNVLAANVNRKFSNAKICAVSWDDNLKKHIISGNTTTPSCFIGYINESYPSLLSTGSYQQLTPTNFGFSEGTNSHILSGNGYFYDGIAYLFQDLRNLNGDGLWVTEINYSTGVVNYSNAYQFPSEKVLIIDVANNFMNLFVLGHHNGNDGTANFEKRYLAQFDLYDPTTYIVKFLEDVDLSTIPWISTYYITQQAYLRNLNLNHNSYGVYSNGAVTDNAYLVETYDLNYDNCNTEIPVTMPTITYNQSSFTPVNASGSNLGTPVSVSVYTTYSLSADGLCGDSKAGNSNKDYEKILQIINEKQTAMSVSESLKIVKEAEIFAFDNNQFLCENFKGICNYKIIDLFGRIIEEGQTENGVFMSINVNNSGIYIIQVTDENNVTASQKITIIK